MPIGTDRWQHRCEVTTYHGHVTNHFLLVTPFRMHVTPVVIEFLLQVCAIFSIFTRNLSLRYDSFYTIKLLLINAIIK